MHRTPGVPHLQSALAPLWVGHTPLPGPQSSHLLRADDLPDNGGYHSLFWSVFGMVGDLLGPETT